MATLVNTTPAAAATTLRLDNPTTTLATASSSSSVSFVPFTLPSTNQRTLGAPHAPGTVIPLALKATTAAAIEAVQRLQKDNKTLTKLLAQHGTVLFRNVAIQSADDFSKFAHAFGFRPHEIIGIVVDRPELAPNVAPANESPRDVLIYNHNESPQVPHAPEYVFFYSHVAPERGGGGETPISSSLELFHRAQQEIPEFIDQLAAKGILSRVTYKPGRQYDGGSTLQQAFGKEIKQGDDEATRRAKIEAQIRRYNRGEHTTWEWTEDGGVVLTHRLPAIRTQQSSGLPTLFTGLAAYYKRAVQERERRERQEQQEPQQPQTNGVKRLNVTTQFFGDGTEIPEHYLKTLADITDEIRVLHRWQRGDVLVYDNVIAQHGRQPWVGKQSDRIVLASLWDGESVPGQYEKSEGSWAQVVQATD
ncbi:hypothetical protein DV735_g4987, partial [Chaetothyriales sp. CBS 134920]